MSYSLKVVEDFLAELREDLPVTLKRVWYSITTGDYIWKEKRPIKLIAKFEALEAWEKVNILYALEEDLKRLNLQTMNFYKQQAREEDAFYEQQRAKEAVEDNNRSLDGGPT